MIGLFIATFGFYSMALGYGDINNIDALLGGIVCEMFFEVALVFIYSEVKRK